MATRTITITNDMFESAAEFLGDSGGTAGRRQFVQSLLNESGLRLQLRGEAHYVTNVVEDQDKVAQVKEEWKAEVAKERAKYPGLSDADYEAKVKADKRTNKIDMLVENGMDYDNAVKQADQEIKFEEDADAEAAKQEGFDKEEYEFRKWVRVNNKDINKEIYVLTNGGHKLVVAYVFEPSILGISGNENIGSVGEFAAGEDINVDMLKTNFSAYLTSAAFSNGMAFISRIVGFDVNINVG